MQLKEIAEKANAINKKVNLKLDETYTTAWTKEKLEGELNHIKEQVEKGKDMSHGCDTGGLSFCYINGKLEISTCHELGTETWEEKVKK